MERVLVRRGQGTEILLMDPALFRLHRYLLILSHARSYTTLLCHILGSHPRISGYGETRMPYETAVDLYRLNAKASEAGNYKRDCQYVLDKLLYDDLIVTDAVLGLARVTPIFVVREPVATIASLARMRIREFEHGLQAWPEGTDRAATVARAAHYYIARLETLRGLSNRLEAQGGRGLVLPGRSILDQTAATLRFLEVALDLDSPLREDYSVFEQTGVPGHGDTSSMIRAGQIVRDRPAEEPIAIPGDLLARANDAYRACVMALECSSVLAWPGSPRIDGGGG